MVANSLSLPSELATNALMTCKVHISMQICAHEVPGPGHVWGPIQGTRCVVLSWFDMRPERHVRS
jgi:hypothetical protein